MTQVTKEKCCRCYRIHSSSGRCAFGGCKLFYRLKRRSTCGRVSSYCTTIRWFQRRLFGGVKARAHSWRAKECFETEKHASQSTEYTEWISIQNLSLHQNFLEELWQQTISRDRLPDQGCDNSRSSHSLSLAVQDLLVYRLILSPYILTTVLPGLQCILPVLFQIWSQERRPLQSEL